MSWVQYGIIVVALFLLAILQASFFPYFSIFGATPNLVFVVFFAIIFFENKHLYAMGFFTAIAAGIFLDIISSPYFGRSIVTLLIIYFMVKLAKYFLKEGGDAYPLSYFVPMFLVGLLVALAPNFSLGAIISLPYSLAFALIAFCLYKIFLKKGDDTNQLKLL